MIGELQNEIKNKRKTNIGGEEISRERGDHLLLFGGEYLYVFKK